MSNRTSAIATPSQTLRASLCFFAYLGLTFVFVSPLLAEEGSGDRLAEIRAQVEEQSKKIAEISEQEASFQREMKGLEASYAVAVANEKRIGQELATLEKTRTQLATELSESEGRMGELRELALRRLRVVYVQSQHQDLPWLVRQLAIRRANLDRSVYFLKRIREHDQQLMRELLDLQLIKQRKRTEISKTLSARDVGRAALVKEREAMGKNLRAKQALLKSMQTEREKMSVAVTALRAQALRLETVLHGLTGGDTLGTVQSTDPGRVIPRESQPSVAGYDGPGLVLKGNYRVPVKGGRAVRGFGDARKVDFEQLITSKGIELSAPAGTLVVGISTGRVIFCGKMPGLGQVVIVDHGKRFYSLYAGLRSISVTRGTEISVGEELGTLGSIDESGKNFYFELRKDGKAINPQKYFKQPLA